MKFKSYVGKKVMLRRGILTFTKEEYSTDCPTEIEVLKGCYDVNLLDEEKPVDEELEAVRLEYLEKTGNKPHHKKSIEKMKEEIAELEA